MLYITLKIHHKKEFILIETSSKELIIIDRSINGQDSNNDNILENYLEFKL